MWTRGVLDRMVGETEGNNNKRNKLLGAPYTYVLHEKGRERLRETTTMRGREKQTVGCTI